LATIPLTVIPVASISPHSLGDEGDCRELSLQLAFAIVKNILHIMMTELKFPPHTDAINVPE
jgi:hypothetical protein